ncbi:hypothetical protein KY363_02360 [Candidatus Woesearchaeota archaeon]|nr:hypothetical protein [Candidatus Woesearchaeota archaeon]
MKYVKTGLCQLGWISCMGCCGHQYKDKLSVAKGIEKNTIEYTEHMRWGRPVKDWMNRSKDRRDSGVCRNLVYDPAKDRIFCPLHPELNSGKDHRIDHHYCDVLHVCKTAFFYDLWDDKTKNDFVKFLRQKRKKGELDWYTYSMGMADDSLLAEFEGLNW